MSEIEVQDHSADYYVNKRYKSYGLKYHSHIISQMMEGIDGKILDVGCGTGIISDLYPDRDIWGIDISWGMLSHHRGKHIVASACDIPWPSCSFDSVVCRSVLHHLPQAEKALREIVRVLKPGGKFVCWETNKSWLAQLVRRFTQHGDRFSDYHSSFSDLGSLIKRYFRKESVRVTFQGYLAYPLVGFPDIIDFGDMVGRSWRYLVAVDEAISRIPIVNRLGFAVMIKAIK